MNIIREVIVRIKKQKIGNILGMLYASTGEGSDALRVMVREKKSVAF